MSAEPSFLVDGAHFFNANGTGIASYARTLANTLRVLRASVAVLYGRQIIAQKNDAPLALTTQLFGNPAGDNAIHKLLNAASRVLHAHAPFGGAVRAREISQAGVMLASLDPPLPKADVVYNANRLYERAGYSFHVRGRLTEVRLDRPAALAHWTSPLAVKARGCPNIYTIHDLIPLQYPHFVLDRGGRSVHLHAAIAREADLIVTVSEASKQAIVDLLNVPAERVAVTYQPTPPLPAMKREDAERLVEATYGLKAGQYALFVGAIEPKKNLKRLIEAFILANPGIPLVLAGPLGWMYDNDLRLMGIINRSSGSKLIRRLGYLPRAHVSALLRCARFLTFPSVCEGFGLPVLEAMQLGVPVLTSNTSSLPEVAGQAAVLVDPLDVADMARGIRELAFDADLRHGLVACGHEQVQKFTEEVYRKRLAAAYARVGVHLPVGEARLQNESVAKIPLPSGQSNSVDGSHR
ncbi:MAG: glycosyltransferase family 1 protein [Pseudomonadota bacterium]